MWIFPGVYPDYSDVQYFGILEKQFDLKEWFESNELYSVY